jgi:hypothetical protein
MVLNEHLKTQIVDPVGRRCPEFLQQFDYDLRMGRAYCRASEWMSYVDAQQWDLAASKRLRDRDPVRSIVKRKVEVTWHKRLGR